MFGEVFRFTWRFSEIFWTFGGSLSDGVLGSLGGFQSNQVFSRMIGGF